MARGRIRKITGIVTKNSSDKTVMVQIETRSKNKKYSNKNYVPNKPGRNSVHDLTRLLKVSSYPTLIFMNSKFNYTLPRTAERPAFPKHFKTVLGSPRSA